MGTGQTPMDDWLRGVLPRAVAYARTLLPRPDRAEDVVQGVLCRLLQHREYDLLENGEKLLFTSITNACINVTTRRRPVLSIDAEDGHGAALQDVLPNPGAREPADELAARDLVDRVGRALAALPRRQRAAVELKSLGWSLRDIADALDVRPENAGVLVHRGRRALRRTLGEELPERLR